MDTYQRQLLQRRLSNFQDEVIATELFDSLPCLTDEQKDQIAYDEKNHLPSKGVRTLVEKLEEHEEGFEQFVHALCEADLGHVAVLLDADYSGKTVLFLYLIDKTSQLTIPIYSSILFSLFLDIPITIRISKRHRERQLHLEREIASKFSNSSSNETKKLRQDFEKV
jgi:hypothetical protein